MIKEFGKIRVEDMRDVNRGIVVTSSYKYFRVGMDWIVPTPVKPEEYFEMHVHLIPQKITTSEVWAVNKEGVDCGKACRQALIWLSGTETEEDISENQENIDEDERGENGIIEESEIEDSGFKDDGDDDVHISELEEKA